MSLILDVARIFRHNDQFNDVMRLYEEATHIVNYTNSRRRILKGLSANTFFCSIPSLDTFFTKSPSVVLSCEYSERDNLCA